MSITKAINDVIITRNDIISTLITRAGVNYENTITVTVLIILTVTVKSKLQLQLGAHKLQFNYIGPYNYTLITAIHVTTQVCMVRMI